MNIVQLYQAGLGMGDRDYYLLDDDATLKVRDAYKQFIGQLFTLTGASPEQADAAVNAVMKIETGIAEISFSREDLRDTQKNYNKIKLDEFKAKTVAMPDDRKEGWDELNSLFIRMAGKAADGGAFEKYE